MGGKILFTTAFLFLAGSACAFVACKPAEKQVQAPPAIPVAVTVAPVVSGPIAASFSRATARRPTKKDAEVRSPIAGVALARHSKPGDTVTATPPTVMAVVADIDLSGVSPGDLVVVSGNSSLSDGARVTYQEP